MRRGRFAPTPSGLLHIGNAFTALLAWLQIRKAGGSFVLRIEDIDTPRCRPEYKAQLVQDLIWLGLDWDEGPGSSGPSAPYEQSGRLAAYAEAARSLAGGGWLYPCYCSRAELSAVARAPHGLASEGAAYPGRCRHLTEAERQRRTARKAPSLRFAVPARDSAFTDGLAGEQRIPAGSLGDFVVQRADGLYSYQLAVTVDDAAMGITDVLRGADLLDSTPRQLLLCEALGLQPPAYHHVPLLCAPDGSRLSKRDRSLSLAALRSAGLPPQRLLGSLAHLAGLLDRPEPASAQELVACFEPSRLPKEPVRIPPGLWTRLSAGA
ncbi:MULTISPECIES: tRNA glutamyl-Q(34) synthetase GluQRS [Paenibacillus]|uniref:tRNA glutamyl-Q(34) synthetase GluQRS n=1 Tax=Paenibacillus TaxID=44249 RepID=UPI0022B863C3|nr:tRNA glutamyl-Q(34) synthetase GluQRS [Paenibacillus caseinilyticus]MCZ8522092.1 tRNA glutamyl-Q(34) synthetase GluQRS [Paenibacillus caseinilyticus]